MSDTKINTMLDKLETLAGQVKILCDKIVAKNQKPESLNGRSIQPKTGQAKAAG